MAKSTARASVFVVLLALNALFSCVNGMVQIQANPEDIQNYLEILPEESGKHDNKVSQVTPQPISVLWGIADTTATVGRLFSFTIPKDAFKGYVTSYKVSPPVGCQSCIYFN